MQRTVQTVAQFTWRLTLLAALASIAWELHGIRDTLIESERAAAADSTGDPGNGEIATEDCSRDPARSSTRFIRAQLRSIRRTPL